MYVFENICCEELPLDFKTKQFVCFVKVAIRVLMISTLFKILRYTNKKNHSEAVIFLIDHISSTFESSNPVSRNFCSEMRNIDNSGISEVYVTS